MEYLINPTNIPVLNWRFQNFRMRDQFELDQQKKQETVEFEIRQEDENRMKMEEELERIRDDTEERVSQIVYNHSQSLMMPSSSNLSICL